MESKMKLVAMSEGCSVNRPRLMLYHPNGKGTGCAMAMKLRPADATQDGFIVVSFANQMTVGNLMGANPNYPKFDWENGVVVRLWFDDLTHMLQVFRGETESIFDGKGLYHKVGDVTNHILLRHMIDPVYGYHFTVEQNKKNGDETRHSILLSHAESFGLCEAITGSLYLIAFGSPYATK